jgi:hypothetical protein
MDDEELISAAKLDWKPLPDSPGDWLWILLWSCKCCIFRSGIAFVMSTKDWDEKDFGVSEERLPGDLALGWEGSRDSYGPGNDGKAVCYKMEIDQVTAWAKISLPAYGRLSIDFNLPAMCSLLPLKDGECVPG